MFDKDNLKGVRERSIDFVLARRALIRAYNRGELSKEEICDAHPELIRAASNLGVEKADECPICKKGKVVNVYYAFGPKLPAHGRCLENRGGEVERYLMSDLEVKVYEVEVCLSCHFNHLTRILAPFVLEVESA
ncbi:MAG: DUF5318 family protein [Actinomycetota bacterium]|nr:DUF5318 family protein [Actinomycetota bacterium]